MPPKIANSEFSQATRAARFVLSKTKLRPRIALVLGSGLGAFADEFANAIRIPYKKIPHYPQSTAIGHAGQLVIGNIGNVPVAGMQGRVHLYEGYSAKEVAFPIRVLSSMGIGAVVLTNAAGGINAKYGKGALVLISDHINLLGQNPLIGANDDRLGLRHPDMTDAYNARFRRLVLAEAKRNGGEVYEGIYAAVAGPSFETPAEIRFLRTIGADLVGMSTVPEVIAARHVGMEVLAISCVTNMAAGMTGEKITAEEVFETGARVREKFLALLRAVLPKLNALLSETKK
jgi:purine-nucleoside phosphorylase